MTGDSDGWTFRAENVTKTYDGEVFANDGISIEVRPGEVYGLLGHYRAHPDTNQERYFFGLLRECLEKGVISEDMLREEMARKHVRNDAFEVLDRVPPLAA